MWFGDYLERAGAKKYSREAKNLLLNQKIRHKLFEYRRKTTRKAVKRFVQPHSRGKSLPLPRLHLSCLLFVNVYLPYHPHPLLLSPLIFTRRMKRGNSLYLITPTDYQIINTLDDINSAYPVSR